MQRSAPQKICGVTLQNTKLKISNVFMISMNRCLPCVRVIGPKSAVVELQADIERFLKTGDNDADKLIFTTQSGIKVTVCEGDLVEQKVGGIVCPVNNEINLGGGCAGAVVRKAGGSLTNECRAYIECMKTLKDTQAIHTTSGELKENTQFVIFVAGPQPSKCTESQMYNGLVETYFNCLLHANDFLHLTSISFPAINAGKITV